MITYFVHSTSLDNERGVRSGWEDSPLSPTGVQQAHDLKTAVAGSNFDLIFASDLIRVVQTAQIVFPDQDIQYDQRLREMNYGVLNGTPDGGFPDDETWCVENRFEKGECCLDVQVRIQDFLDSSIPRGSNVAVISHKYPQLALEVICNNRSWRKAIESDWRTVGAWQPGWVYAERA
jgi:broad specificity phosphatase PhoE